MKTGEPFVRASRHRPCPACGKPDWCKVAGSGEACLCARVRSDDRRGEAGWLHKFQRDRPMVLTPRAKRVTTDWRLEAERYAAGMTPEVRGTLERLLRLPAGALGVFPLLGLGQGVRPDEAEVRKGRMAFATFPEVDGAGRVVGLCRRFADHSKFQVAGGSRGLSVPHGFNPAACETVFVVEGPTDVAAMAAAGLNAIGRPSNTGGGYDAACLLQTCPDHCRVVVVGENDRKADHLHPGLHGAAVVADQIAHNLQRRPGAKRFPALWAMCPDGAKDVRAWLTAPHWGVTTWAMRGERLAAAILRSAIPAEPMEDAVRRLLAENERTQRRMAEVESQMKEILEKLSRQ